jgi:hypothetical protein
MQLTPSSFSIQATLNSRASSSALALPFSFGLLFLLLSGQSGFERDVRINVCLPMWR